MERVMTAVTAICFMLISGTGAWTINTESDPIEALLGEYVKLPCEVSDIDTTDGDTPDGNTPDGVPKQGDVAVYWTHISLNGTVNEVYQFYGYQQTPFRPDSNIDFIDLYRGDASLYLPDVKISDEGQYNCDLYIFDVPYKTSLSLLVSSQPEVNLTDSVSVTVGDETSVACNLTQFYPKDVEIQWIKHSNRTDTNSYLDGNTTTPTKNSDGTFSVSSTLTVRPNSTEETGDEYFCIVSHRSLITNIERSFTLNVTEIDQSFLRSTIGIVIVSLALVAVPLTVGVLVVECKQHVNLENRINVEVVLFSIFGFFAVGIAIVWWRHMNRIQPSSIQWAVAIISMIILVVLVFVGWLRVHLKRKSQDTDTKHILKKESGSQDPPSYSSTLGDSGYNHKGE